MIHIYLLFATVISSTAALDSSLSALGKVYHGRGYNASGIMLAQVVTSNKLTCAAVCSNRRTACRIAVYDSSAGVGCRLYSEALVAARLFVSSSAVVYEFQPAKAQAIGNSFRWNRTGITVAGSSTGTAGVASNLFKSPYGFALNAAKELFVADYWNNRAQKWLLNGANGTTVAGRADGLNGSSPSTLSAPGFVLLDANNNIVLADRLNHRLVYWANGATSGTTIAGTAGVNGSSNSLLSLPGALVRDPSTNALLIADSGNHRILSYATNATSGTVIAGGNGPGLGATQLNTPHAFTLDETSNSLVIANYEGNNVVRWVLGASSWTLLAGSPTGQSGSTNMLLDHPICVTLDFAGNLYVVDSNNHRVQFFLNGQTNGTTIAGTTGYMGTTPTQLRYPVWMVLDEELNMYVSDAYNNRVQFYQSYPIQA